MNWVLGLWDGHDAGAALMRDGELIFAINEERLSRRKLEVGFPARSVRAALEFAALQPEELSLVAASTADVAKTLARWFPALGENYYRLRRRKTDLTPMARLKKRWKYRITEWGPNAVSRKLSGRALRQRLQELGLGSVPLELVGHHDAHAATAAFFSGFESCLVVTLDGVGDGLSGSIWNFEGGTLRPVTSIPARNSFGIFFEHVTNLLNMRELEDEGKVMALAGFTSPVPDSENPMLGFFQVKGLEVEARYSSVRLYDELARLLWRWPSEQFAYMAQRSLEVWVQQLVRNALETTGQRKLALAGGVASNVKLNMLLRELPALEELFVFPHMGDGGLAVGAAAWVSGGQGKSFESPYLGPEFTAQQEFAAIQESGLGFALSPDISAEAARLIASGEVICWFQGRMEFGPRALGARSILARPDSTELRDELNLKLKKRSWFQPYCPVMLEEEAARLLLNYKNPNPLMTCAYRVKQEARSELAGVIAPDGTCRPQIISDAAGEAGPHSRYARLLRETKKLTGRAVLLNTSFNLHGEPIVCSPADALRTFSLSSLRYLVLGEYLVSK